MPAPPHHANKMILNSIAWKQCLISLPIIPAQCFVNGTDFCTWDVASLQVLHTQWQELVSASALRTLVPEDLQGKYKEPQVEKEPEKPLTQGLKHQEVGETPVTSCLKSMEREGKAEGQERAGKFTKNSEQSQTQPLGHSGKAGTSKTHSHPQSFVVLYQPEASHAGKHLEPQYLGVVVNR